MPGCISDVQKAPATASMIIMRVCERMAIVSMAQTSLQPRLAFPAIQAHLESIWVPK